MDEVIRSNSRHIPHRLTIQRPRTNYQFQMTTADTIYLIDGWGQILMREDWELLKNDIDAFYEGESPGYVYLMHAAGTKWYKIGVSKQPEVRQEQLSTKTPYEVVMISHYSDIDPLVAEKEWHKAFADKRVRGEWFELSDADIEEFKEIASLIRAMNRGEI